MSIDGEPIFLLRASDPSSSHLVRQWADRNVKNREKSEEALAVADAMEKWRLIMEMDKPKILRPEKVAERWNCTSRHVYHLIEKGELPAFRIGGKLVRVLLEDIERYEQCRDLGSRSSSLGVGITPSGENAEKSAESPSVPKIVRQPTRLSEILPTNTRWPTGQK